MPNITTIHAIAIIYTNKQNFPGFQGFQFPQPKISRILESGFPCIGRISHKVRTLFWPKKSRTFQGLSRTPFPFFKDSIQCKEEPWIYVFFSSSRTCMSNFILKVFLCLLGWIKLAPKFKDFPALTAIFKDFQGLEFLLGSLSKDVSGQYTSTGSEAFYVRRSNTSLLKLFILKFKVFQGACEPCSYYGIRELEQRRLNYWETPGGELRI